MVRAPPWLLMVPPSTMMMMPEAETAPFTCRVAPFGDDDVHRRRARLRETEIDPLLDHDVLAILVEGLVDGGDKTRVRRRRRARRHTSLASMRLWPLDCGVIDVAATLSPPSLASCTASRRPGPRPGHHPHHRPDPSPVSVRARPTRGLLVDDLGGTLDTSPHEFTCSSSPVQPLPGRRSRRTAPRWRGRTSSFAAGDRRRHDDVRGVGAPPSPGSATPRGVDANPRSAGAVRSARSMFADAESC